MSWQIKTKGDIQKTKETLETSKKNLPGEKWLKDTYKKEKRKSEWLKIMNRSSTLSVIGELKIWLDTTCTYSVGKKTYKS